MTLDTCIAKWRINNNHNNDISASMTLSGSEYLCCYEQMSVGNHIHKLRDEWFRKAISAINKLRTSD